MSGIDLYRKNLDGTIFNAPVELRAFEGWIQWRHTDSDDDWMNLHEIPVDGADGSTGATGADGAPGAGAEPLTFDLIDVWARIPLASILLTGLGKLDCDLSAIAEAANCTDLELIAAVKSNANATSDGVVLGLNNDFTAANYRSNRLSFSAAASHQDGQFIGHATGATAHAADFAHLRIWIPFFQGAARKSIMALETARYAAATNDGGYSVALNWENTAPITRVTLQSDQDPTEQLIAGSSLRVYGYRQVTFPYNLGGGGMLVGDTGAPGAAGVDGYDGREIELQIVPGESGDCQLLQSRYAGDSEWVTLAEIPACGDGDQPPQNLQMNRCGVAVAVVNDLHRMYARYKADGTVYDTLQGAATLVSDGGNLVVAAAVIAGAIVGAPIVAGVAAAGAVASAAGKILNWLFSQPNQGIDEWDTPTEEFLVSAFYCVLTRRETVTISADVLREFISFAADAPIAQNDRDLLMLYLGALPVSYWQNTALVAQPNINDCLDECVSRSGDWCTELGNFAVDSLQWFAPVVSTRLGLLVGRVDDLGDMRGVPTPLDTLLYAMSLHFGRQITLGGFDIGITYLQSRESTEPAIIVTDDLGRNYGTLYVTGDTGVIPVEGLLQWRAPVGETVQMSALSFTGKIAVLDSGALTDEILRVDYIRLCGENYSPYGEYGINCDGCEPLEEPDPCDDMHGYPFCKTFPLGSNLSCWNTSPYWMAGIGMAAVNGQQNSTHKWKRAAFNLGVGSGGNGANVALRRVEMDATFEAPTGSNSSDPYIRFTVNLTGEIVLIDEYPTVGRHLYFWEGVIAAPQFWVHLQAWHYNSYPNTVTDKGGLLVLHSVTAWYADGSVRTWVC